MINKKLVFLIRFVSTLFLRFVKGIRKKKDEVFLTFVTIHLLIFEKGDKGSIEPVFYEGL